MWLEISGAIWSSFRVSGAGCQLARWEFLNEKFSSHFSYLIQSYSTSKRKLSSTTILDSRYGELFYCLFNYITKTSDSCTYNRLWMPISFPFCFCYFKFQIRIILIRIIRNMCVLRIIRILGVLGIRRIRIIKPKSWNKGDINWFENARHEWYWVYKKSEGKISKQNIFYRDWIWTNRRDSRCHWIGIDSPVF